jgi:hypothetical protein
MGGGFVRIKGSMRISTAQKYNFDSSKYNFCQIKIHLKYNGRNHKPSRGG